MEVCSQVPSQSSAHARTIQQHRYRVLSTVFVALGVTLVVSMVIVRTAAPAAVTGAARIAAKALRPAAAHDPTVAFALAPLPLPRSPASSGQQQPRSSLTVRPMPPLVRPAHGVVPLQMMAGEKEEKPKNNFFRNVALVGGLGFALAFLQGSGDPYGLPEAPDPSVLTGVKTATEGGRKPLNAANGISPWRYSQFMNAVEADEVETVLFSPDGVRCIVADTDGKLHSLDALPKDPDMMKDLQKHKVDIEILPPGQLR